MDALTYATLQVVIDNQAWLFAAHSIGTDGPDDEFRAHMDDWKETTGTLINEVLEQIVAELQEEEE